MAALASRIKWYSLLLIFILVILLSIYKIYQKIRAYWQFCDTLMCTLRWLFYYLSNIIYLIETVQSKSTALCHLNRKASEVERAHLKTEISRLRSKWQRVRFLDYARNDSGWDFSTTLEMTAGEISWLRSKWKLDRIDTFNQFRRTSWKN